MNPGFTNFMKHYDPSLFNHIVVLELHVLHLKREIDIKLELKGMFKLRVPKLGFRASGRLGQAELPDNLAVRTCTLPRTLAWL